MPVTLEDAVFVVCRSLFRSDETTSSDMARAEAEWAGSPLKEPAMLRFSFDIDVSNVVVDDETESAMRLLHDYLSP